MSLCLWVLTFLSLSFCSNPSGSSVNAPLPIIACPFSQSQGLLLFDFVCSANVLSFFWFPYWPPHLFSHTDFLSLPTRSIALNSFSFISPWEFNFLPHLIPVSYPYCSHVKVFHFRQFQSCLHIFTVSFPSVKSLFPHHSNKTHKYPWKRENSRFWGAQGRISIVHSVHRPTPAHSGKQRSLLGPQQGNIWLQ